MTDRSPDYIRGQRDAFERAAEIVSDNATGMDIDVFRVNNSTLKNSLGHTRFISTERVYDLLRSRAEGIRAEAAKLPEADGIDWQARAENAEYCLTNSFNVIKNMSEANQELLRRLPAAEAALAAMTERCRVLEEALDIEEPYLIEAVENQDDEDGPGIMFSDIEGAFHRIRTGQSASLHAEWAAQRAAAVLTAERGGADV